MGIELPDDAMHPVRWTLSHIKKYRHHLPRPQEEETLQAWDTYVQGLMKQDDEQEQTESEEACCDSEEESECCSGNGSSEEGRAEAQIPPTGAEDFPGWTTGA